MGANGETGGVEDAVSHSHRVSSVSEEDQQPDTHGGADTCERGQFFHHLLGDDQPTNSIYT